ncbi:HAD family hydrolase [Chitinophaga silvatica]|uniref:HAD family hydrolase n=1 Tax=Chitinophaga silvatica TaxID=2282649 RepID=UPI001313DFDD|nr:HAD family hydrolase [Chitinophaga silvatica]
MTIAFFDFDGTITRKDTLWEIIRFHRGSAALYAGIIQLLPALVRFKLKMISAQQVKEQVLGYYFGGIHTSAFKRSCEEFCRTKLHEVIRPKALAAIKDHQQKGHHVVVVTASGQDWVAPWCRVLNIVCIGSQLEAVDQHITGNLLGKNCNGEEKVDRIRKAYRLENFKEIYAYGDTKGDLPMLELAQHRFFKPFR